MLYISCISVKGHGILKFNFIRFFRCHGLLKILQTRFQQYVNHKLPDGPAGFRKGRGTRDQIANIHWIMEKAGVSRKASISVLLTMPKPLTVWITINWKIPKEMGTPDHLTCLLRNLYAGQEATVRTGHGTTDWFQIGKGDVRAYWAAVYGVAQSRTRLKRLSSSSSSKAVYCHPAYLTYMQSTS